MTLTVTTPYLHTPQQLRASSVLRFAGTPPLPVPSGLQQLHVSTNNLLAKIFRPAAEDYLKGIMVVDVFALWIPRVLVALFRGAYDYDPETDPRNIGKSKWTRFWRNLHEEAKGLNWQNAWEETGREIASGPALFAIPTLTYVLSQNRYGKSAYQMSQSSLQTLANTFAQHLKERPPEGHTLSQSFTSFVESLFGDTAMKQAAMPDGNTYGHFLKNWSQRLTTTLEQLHHKQSLSGEQKNAARETLKTLKKELGQKIQEYNRSYQAEKAFYAYEQTLVRWLPEKGLDWQIKAMDTSTIFEHLTRWKDFTAAVEALKEKAPTADWSELIEAALKKTLNHKMIYSVGTTLATLAFLFKLVHWVQYHKSYSANRRIELDALQKLIHEESTPAIPVQPVQPSGQIPFQMIPPQTAGAFQYPAPFNPIYPAWQPPGGAA